MNSTFLFFLKFVAKKQCRKFSVLDFFTPELKSFEIFVIFWTLLIYKQNKFTIFNSVKKVFKIGWLKSSILKRNCCEMWYKTDKSILFLPQKPRCKYLRVIKRKINSVGSVNCQISNNPKNSTKGIKNSNFFKNISSKSRLNYITLNYTQ